MSLIHSPNLHSSLIARIPVVTGRDLAEWFHRLESGPAFLRCDERAHWLALTALWTTAGFFRDLLPGAEFSVHPVADQWERLAPGTVRILESHGFCELNDHLPHTWDVTSDSIAGQAAVVYGATRLILLKSIDIPPGTSWLDAVRERWVDPFFPWAVADFQATIEVVNFRRWLDDTAPTP